MYKKGLLTLVCLAIMVCMANIGFAKDAAPVKRCPCKKIFEQTLNLSPQQVELADANRKEEGQNLKPINAKIIANNKKILEIKESNLSEDKKTAQIQKLKDKNAALNEQKSEVKVKYNSNFESYLSDEQKQTLEKMREDKKAGKSCCPCGKNRYY